MWKAYENEARGERNRRQSRSAPRRRTPTCALRDVLPLPFRGSSQVSNFRFEIRFLAAAHDPADGHTAR